MADAAHVKIKTKSCRSCGRNFVPESLAKHEPICLKQASKKRKVFDSTKQRAEGTEVSYRQMKQAQKKEVKPPKSHWREQHRDFINTIRSAKQVTIAMERGDPLPPPPPPSINPDYIQCPHCGRRFNEKAAQRHIKFCEEQQMRNAMNKPRANTQAKAKMDARNSYQVPKPKGRGAASSPGYSSPGARGSPSTGARASPSTGSGRTPVGTTGSGYGRQPAPVGATGSGYGRTPASVGTTGSSGYGRTPAPASRGRPSPSTNQYQASDYGDSPTSGLEGSAMGVPSGRVLRTGRNSSVYNDAKRGTRPGSTGMPKSKSSSSIRAAGAGTKSPGFGRQSPSMPLGFTGGISRENESGYYSSSSENEVHHHQYGSKQIMSRFCHDCGTKYPVSNAKFCCECGVKRLAIM